MYVMQTSLDSAIKTCANQKIFVKNLLLQVYTKEAMIKSTLQGFPPRGKRSEYYRKHPVPPRLHPDGVAAIIREFYLPNIGSSWNHLQLVGADVFFVFLLI